MEKQVSRGVKVLGWIYLIGGLLSILSTFTGRGSYAVWKSVFSQPVWVTYMTMTFLLGVGGLVGGIGILKVYSWARILIIWVAILNVMEALFLIPILYLKGNEIMVVTGITAQKLSPQQFTTITTITMLPGIIFFLATIYFFMLSKIKEQFK